MLEPRWSPKGDGLRLPCLPLEYGSGGSPHLEGKALEAQFRNAPVTQWQSWFLTRTWAGVRIPLGAPYARSPQPSGARWDAYLILGSGFDPSYEHPTPDVNDGRSPAS